MDTRKTTNSFQDSIKKMKSIFITTDGERTELNIKLSKKAEKELEELEKQICMGCPLGKDCPPDGKCMIQLK